MKADFDIPVSPDMLSEQPGLMSIDEAVDGLFERNGWPLLGGPSGRGASYVTTAQRCARLFQVTFDLALRDEGVRQQVLGGSVPEPLQIGALVHSLWALYYAPEMAQAWRGKVCVAPERQGLVYNKLVNRDQLPDGIKMWVPPKNGADQLIDQLKHMCNADDKALLRQLKKSLAKLPEQPIHAPSLNVVLEAERLFDAHTRNWANEDVVPLAIEWYAAHPELGYTCRYDMIGRVGKGDPAIPPGLYIFERKTARYADEKYLDGWSLDNEILGQLLLWEPSGCEERFGKLTGLVMDVVTKEKMPKCRRHILPPQLPGLEGFERAIRFTHAQIHMWRAFGFYPQILAGCHNQYGRCSQWDRCATGATP